MKAEKQPAINVAIPNTIEKKMEAIASLARANEELARAINSVNVNVTVANNIISNTETGITVKTQ